MLLCYDYSITSSFCDTVSFNTGAEKLLNIEMPATNPKASTETLQALTAGSSNIPIQNKTMPTADLTAIFGTPSPNTDTPAATLQMFADMNR